MILVTGSTGHLGEALVRTLRAAGRDVRGIDLLPSPYTDVVGTIADRDLVSRAMTGVRCVVHTATLHKPHVATHRRRDFVDTNITGTLHLLEEAVAHGVDAFVYTSTTSTFGDALSGWVDESVVPVPKNIYGVTKVAAEDLCALAHRNQKLPTIVLRTSRFFPEIDDDPMKATSFDPDNLKVCEYLYRRVDIEDVVDAHLVAIDRARAIGHGRYIISATTPFLREDVDASSRDPASLVDRRAPGWRDVFARRDWRMLPSIDRIYDNTRARDELGWRPRHDFTSIVQRAATGDHRSELARAIGAKGYHAINEAGAKPRAPSS